MVEPAAGSRPAVGAGGGGVTFPGVARSSGQRRGIRGRDPRRPLPGSGGAGNGVRRRATVGPTRWISTPSERVRRRDVALLPGHGVWLGVLASPAARHLRRAGIADANLRDPLSPPARCRWRPRRGARRRHQHHRAGADRGGAVPPARPRRSTNLPPGRCPLGLVPERARDLVKNLAAKLGVGGALVSRRRSAGTGPPLAARVPCSRPLPGARSPALRGEFPRSAGLLSPGPSRYIASR